MVVLLESFWAWGWIIAALIAYLLIPVYGWRIGFFLGGVPALYAAYLRKNIPESPRYLEQEKGFQEADKIVSEMERQAGIKNDIETVVNHPKEDKVINITLLDLWSQTYRRRTFVLWILWLGINFGYYGFVLWIPTLLVGKGYSLVKGFEFTLIMCFAQLPGYYSAAYLIERIGRKAVLVVYLAGTALSSYLFGQAASVTNVLVFGCLLYFFSLGAWGAVYAYTPEVYPTRARGSGTGWAAAVGRIGAIAAPYIVGLVYETNGKQAGFTYVFLMLTMVFAVVAVVIAIVGIETKGRTLEEINETK
jgi:putative MFS transporter